MRFLYTIFAYDFKKKKTKQLTETTIKGIRGVTFCFNTNSLLLFFLTQGFLANEGKNIWTDRNKNTLRSHENKFKSHAEMFN